MDQPPPSDLFEAAKQSLSQRDFHKCREYALAVPKSDPRFPGVDQILAVADTLIASEAQVTKAKVPDWYAILQLNRYCYRYSLIADQFKKLYSLLNPDENRFPLANEAAELVYRAYSVLNDFSTKVEFDVKLSKENSTFWVVCTICFDRFVYDNKAYEGGDFKCQKCRIKPIKPQSKNDLKIIEKSEAKGTIRSNCMQCSDDQECWDCIIRYLDADIDSFSAYFPCGFDEGCEWIDDILNSTPTGAVNLTGQEILTGGNKSVADHQINEVEGGDDDDTIWISCPACRKTNQYSGARQKHSFTCKNLECRGKGHPPVIIILCQKVEDETISGENVKILKGKGVDASGKDNAGNGKGNGNQGTNVTRNVLNPFSMRAKNLTGQENLSGKNKSDADHGINVEGVGYAKGGENAAAAADCNTIWASCPHCFCKFKCVGVHQEGLLKCQNAVCGKEFSNLDAMNWNRKEEDTQGKNREWK